MTKNREKSSSWEAASKWYSQAVGGEGLYYHKKIILPKVLAMLDVKNEQASVLDLACGQGVLARHLPKHIAYAGLDISPSLIKDAKKQDINPSHEYFVADVEKPFPFKGKSFSFASIILAIQNIRHPDKVFKNAAAHLGSGGRFVIVMNHPCFRIPRQSSWQVDQAKKLQFRRIDRYYTPMEIPIQAHPSKGQDSSNTLSFHFPLSSYSKWLFEAGFVIEAIEEWCSDKISEGANAKMENFARQEFPLFLTIVARKN